MSTEALKRNLPRFELDQVRASARELYGIRGEYVQQDSERDLSWRVNCDDGETDAGPGQRWCIALWVLQGNRINFFQQ